MSTWAAPRLLNVKEPEDDSGLLLYEPFYGLSEKPFSLSTDPRFLYKSASHTPVFHDVLAGIRRREGLVVLTGEIGMGKTTLCRSVLAALDRKTFSAFVPDPFVSREDLLKILLVEFGVVSVDDLVRGRLQGASRAELSYPLYEFLRSLEPLDAFAVLLIDEAQNLSASLLEEVRILSDLEGTRKLLQVVLIGQPELSSALQLPHMRQVRQRVTTHCELQPLDRDGVYGYVGHRLMVAGAAADRLHFTADALDLVYAATDGVPRVINRLCDRTLQRGQAARAATIGPDLVSQAMADLQLVPAAPADAPVAVLAEPLAPQSVPPLAEVLASAAAADSAPVAPTPAAVAPAPAVETAVSDPDDLHALLALPPMASPALEIVAVPPRAERPPVAAARPRARAPQPRLYREAPATGRSRAAVATAALLVLGALSGLTLAVYWAWARPMVTERVALPPVTRPSMRIAAPLPAVLEPNIEAVGDPLELPQVPAAGHETPDADVLPPRPVSALPAAAASQSVWVVQVGAFADDARANVLVGQLAERGFTAFKGATTMRSGTPLHLVLAGPFQTRAAAADALDKIEEIPGVGQPILQLVPPAAAARH
ncbi:MAG TPA: AAA family ATPase [Vicinamibacterales bacterium]|jgi:type II secretory pathway predicted ATPase ExeA|nr:AAA family ATPase [Vicinamibacterales bacterium]